MTIEERLEILERELARATRRNHWFLAVIGLAGGLFALSWYSTGTTGRAAVGAEKQVIARMFILEDENGKPRATLGVLKKEPRLDMLDEKGETRAALAVFKDGPGLTLFDEKGKTRASVVVLRNKPMIGLSDENGKLIWFAPR